MTRPEPGEWYESGDVVVEVTDVDGDRVDYDYVKPPGGGGDASVGVFRDRFDPFEGASVAFAGP